jgi:Phage integrase, N-terminal SAM-like domain
LHRLRPYTRLNYRATLDRVLLPRFGAMKTASITPEHVASLIRDLEQSGLSRALAGRGTARTHHATADREHPVGFAN